MLNASSSNYVGWLARTIKRASVINDQSGRSLAILTNKDGLENDAHIGLKSLRYLVLCSTPNDQPLRGGVISK